MVLIILAVLAWWFLWKKTYYVRIDMVPEGQRQVLQQALKIELETTLRNAVEVTTATPYLVSVNNYFDARSLIKLLQKHQGVAAITWHWVWDKPEVGPVKS